MEDLVCRKLFMLMCIGTIASTAIPKTKASNEVTEWKNFFIDKIHEIENQYEDKLEALRVEMMHNNEILLKSVEELNVKLENERKKSDAIQQLQKDFLEKETQLTTEIKDLKNQLITYSSEVDHLKESMSERKMDMIMPKEKGDIVSDAFTTKSNPVEDGATSGGYMQNKEATRAGFKRQTAFYASAQVAFSARLSNNTPPLSPDQVIVFNDVLLNVGSAYNNSHGVFEAPVPGVYFFTMSLLAYGTKSHHAKLVKDGQELARADFNDADSFDDSSQAVIVQLGKGNVVTVQNADYSGMVYNGYNYCTFSGFLLYEYEDMSPVVGK